MARAGLEIWVKQGTSTCSFVRKRSSFSLAGLDAKKKLSLKGVRKFHEKLCVSDMQNFNFCYIPVDLVDCYKLLGRLS